MKHLIKKTIGLIVLIVCLLGSFSVAYAADRNVDVTINVVIDNAAQYPAECSALNSRYTVTGIYKMLYDSTYGNRPTNQTEKQFTVADGATTTVTFNSKTISGSLKSCNSLWFEANSYTDAHLSLVSLEYSSNDNLGAFTYSPTGDISNPYTVQPFNWLQIVDPSLGVANVTAHFRYNPDISQMEPEPDPDPGYTKSIDYLGDGIPNPDTTSNGVNDYRLYLDMTTQMAADDNKADIIFVLDTSGSMNYALGGSNRITVLKNTMVNSINNLTQNQYNRISIIQFSGNSQVLVSNSTDRQELINCINGLRAGGGTNYYAPLSDAVDEINTMISNDTENREKVVIFISDGEPNLASPAAVTRSNNSYAGMIYSCVAIRKFQNVDRFYSIFIGDDTGSASTLQTITQIVNVNKEKYTVQALSAEQVSNTLARFMAKMNQSLYNVSITDTLAEYVTYAGGLKVTRSTAGQNPVTLVAGADYQVSAGTDTVGVTLNDTTMNDTKYTLSFNVRSSEAALDYYDQNQSFPDIGDANTDYDGNTTSSGQPGFYSNVKAVMAYSFGGNGYAEKTYNKPVVQAVQPDAVSEEIRVRKVLEGKTLEAGMFSFELRKLTETEAGIEEEVVATATNDADGFITFDEIRFATPGTYMFDIREVIPPVPEAGITYDENVIQLTAVVTRDGDALAVDIQYPSEAVFVNTYEPVPVIVNLSASKELTGRTLDDGMFSFRLLTNLNILVEKVSNNKDGEIQFAPLTFTKAGTYTYSIRESVPVPASPNFIYDLKTVTAKIIVTDNNGVLAAAVKYTPDAVFRNTFVYTATNSTIELKKILTGMQLTTGMFEFELKDMATGEKMTETNKADGTICFDLSYNNPGTYVYQIKEIEPDSHNKHITYDKKTITVTVNVTDDGTGNLIVSTTYHPTDAVFYNSYKVRSGIW